jgi:hypothetical protein
MDQRGKTPDRQKKKKNTAGAWVLVSFECCVFCVGSDLCVGLITRPEDFYQVWCVLV